MGVPESAHDGAARWCLWYGGQWSLSATEPRLGGGTWKKVLAGPHPTTITATGNSGQIPNHAKFVRQGQRLITQANKGHELHLLALARRSRWGCVEGVHQKVHNHRVGRLQAMMSRGIGMPANQKKLKQSKEEINRQVKNIWAQGIVKNRCLIRNDSGKKCHSNCLPPKKKHGRECRRRHLALKTLHSFHTGGCREER